VHTLQEPEPLRPASTTNCFCQFCTPQVAEADISARLARSEDAARKLEGDLAAGRTRCAQLESSVRSKDLGLDKLSKALDAQRKEEHDTTLQVGWAIAID
jgi:septal ring factor EnvC (AmiA/AmiB activator)